MTDSPWTTPAQIRERVRRLWMRGDLLRAHLAESGASIELPLKRPDSRALSERFDEVRSWIRTLEEGSKARRGFGYDIVWAEINHRTLGLNRVPQRVELATTQDALRLIDASRESRTWVLAAKATVEQFPELKEWVERKPLTLVEYEREWERVLAVLDWFRRNPRPGVYLRQLDIPGVDSKFIESHKGVLAELLDRILPREAIDETAPGSRFFERRYGLLSKPALVRFRVLDPAGAIGGFSDLAVPIEQLARMPLEVDRVFVTENDANGLAFPPVARSIVIFGLGYGIDGLAQATWLSKKRLHYWGDIDTHGFAILDRMRRLFPQCSSLLMDRETLFAHRDLWTHEAKPYDRPLEHLTREESALFEDLRSNALGSGVRLEQERIAFGQVERAIGGLVRPETARLNEIGLETGQKAR